MAYCGWLWPLPCPEAAVTPDPFMQNNPIHLFTTPWFWSAFGAWSLAQIVKMFNAFLRTRRLDFHYFVSTGGMPSAHSAMVCALATSIGITEGFDHAVTMLAASFAAITMFDAASVRRAAGHQARVLNQMIDELFKQHKLKQTRLKELLGHTRKEVFVGMALGIAVAVIVVHLWPNPLRTSRCPASPNYGASAATAPAPLPAAPLRP